MNKTKEVLIYLLSHPLHEKVSTVDRIFKEIYLSDWKHSLEYGSQITDIKWFFDNRGPSGGDEVINVINSKEFKTDGEKIEVHSLKNKTLMKESELFAINHVVNVTNKLKWSDFVRLICSTYPVFSSNRYSLLDLSLKSKEYKELW